MNRFRLLALLCCLLPFGLAHASRIRTSPSVEGVRSNQLIGYGLVVGLPGTGRRTTPSPSRPSGPCSTTSASRCLTTSSPRSGRGAGGHPRGSAPPFSSRVRP